VPTTSLPPATTTAPVAISTPSSTAPVDLPSGWAYSGCWTDGTYGRILAHQQPDSTSNTIEGCIATCSSLGMSIAGLEYSSQCFCDNFVRNQGAVSGNSNCAMKCSGNDAQICGGPGLLSMYSTSAPRLAAVPVIKKTELPGSWSWKGCYSDAVGNRAFGPNGVETESLTLNSAEYCLNYCASLGYDAAGTEYSKQCCKCLAILVLDILTTLDSLWSHLGICNS
jgi:hypothetical protein